MISTVDLDKLIEKCSEGIEKACNELKEFRKEVYQDLRDCKKSIYGILFAQVILMLLTLSHVVVLNIHALYLACIVIAIFAILSVIELIMLIRDLNKINKVLIDPVMVRIGISVWGAFVLTITLFIIATLHVFGII